MKKKVGKTLVKKKKGVIKETQKIKREIREIKEEKNLEDEIKETFDSGLREFLQPLNQRRTAPVLERVAVVQSAELEQHLANASFQSRENGDENTLKYGEAKVDYGTARGNDRNDKVK